MTFPDVITKYTLLAIAIITFFDHPLRIYFNTKRSKIGSYLILLTIAILTITAYNIYKVTHSLGITLLVCNLLGMYDTFLSTITFYVLKRKSADKNEIDIKSTAVFNLFLTAIVASDSAYAGYVLSGGKTSFFMIVLVLFFSISIFVFSSWLHFRKKENDVDRMKRRLQIRMNELNALGEIDQGT